ncbi:hypothetical protein CK215_29785 [Mesorhizobium sp. WSM3864]|nr:hypothetical protein CK215_29785 [Mesorhizobium sp. WSM3864]
MLKEVPRGIAQILQNQPNAVRGTAKGLKALAEVIAETLCGLSNCRLGFAGAAEEGDCSPVAAVVADKS